MGIRETVSETLLGRRMELPPEVPPELLPEGVVLREGRWIPVLGGVFGRMKGPAAAVTLRRTIIVHPRIRLSSRLLLHELAHVRQWGEDPLFPVRYTLETLRAGYRDNRYEREAREAAASPNRTRD